MGGEQTLHNRSSSGCFYPLLMPDFDNAYINIKMPNVCFPPRSLRELIVQGDVFLRLHVLMVHLKFLGSMYLPDIENYIYNYEGEKYVYRRAVSWH